MGKLGLKSKADNSGNGPKGENSKKKRGGGGSSIFKREPRTPPSNTPDKGRPVRNRKSKAASPKQNSNTEETDSQVSGSTLPSSPLSWHQSPPNTMNMTSDSSVTQPKQAKTTPENKSIVSSVLNMVDMSCVSSGFVPSDGEGGQQPSRPSAFRPTLTFPAPEWGVSPDDAPTHGSPQRRHEMFELVYQEVTPPVAKTNRVTSWIQQRKTHRSSSPLGIAARSTAPEPSLIRNHSPRAEPVIEPAEFIKKRSNPAARVFKVFGGGGKSTETAETADESDSDEKRAGDKRTLPSLPSHPVRKVLESIKGSKLETVQEEQSDDSVSELKVRVPGEPNKFITDKDLLGDEVVEEIYALLEIPEEPSQEEDPPSRERQAISSAPGAVLTPTRSPKRGEYHQFESDDDEDKLDIIFPVSSNEDSAQSRTWKDRLGLAQSGSGESDKFKKPMWKATVDHNSGRTYYYHRRTRETTWTKPPDDEIIPPPAKKSKKPKKSKPKQKPDQKKSRPEQSSLKKVPLASSLKKSGTTARRFSPKEDPPVQDGGIDRMLSDLSPDAGAKVLQTQGEQLLDKLRNIVDTQPFDEPIAHPEKNDEKSLANRTQAAATIYSGFSSHKSRISEKTEPIKNTSSAINRKQNPVSPARPLPRIPKNIPVPRLRELNVEEFSTTDFADRRRTQGPPRSKKKENNMREPLVSAHAQEYPSFVKHDEDPEDYDDADDKDSYAGTDSISALSEDNLSYAERREMSYEDARRRALQRAIAQQDWDLAAQMTESLKKQPSTRPHYVARKESQSEIDYYVARNNWSNVESYIHNEQVRAHQTERRRMHQHLGSTKPQKRFGARSQLQHRELGNSADSLDDSFCTGPSDSGSERTGPPPPRAQARRSRPREFAC